MPGDRHRIDRWLWHVRVARTRSAAASLVVAGYVRVNGGRVGTASYPVKRGDVITVTLDRGVRLLRVLGFAAQRSDAGAARALYEDVD